MNGRNVQHTEGFAFPKIGYYINQVASEHPGLTILDEMKTDCCTNPQISLFTASDGFGKRPVKSASQDGSIEERFLW